MLTEHLVLFGAGGHAAVVLDAVGEIPLRVADDNAALAKQHLLGRAIEAPVTAEAMDGCRFHVAIGDNADRARLSAAFTAAGGRAETVIHGAACISTAATIDPGCFIAARAVIAPRAFLGKGTIVNHGAIVDHDCSIGKFCHIAPNATLGGNVTIGEGVLVGAGAIVLPGVRVGTGSVVAAGAVVNRDIPDGEIWMGVPARKYRQDDNA